MTEGKEPKVFPTIKVSVDLHKMVRAVEQAAVAVVTAEGSTALDHLKKVEEAYAILSYARKFLYEYLEDLERLAEIEPSDGWTQLRFT